MSNVARIGRERHAAPVQIVARVGERGAPGTWTLEAGNERWEARRAMGCLVEPAPGDMVLAVVHAAGCHVLCVLEREAGAPNVLAVEGDLAIEARGGSVAIAAHHDLELVAARRARVVAGAVDVTAVDGTVAVRRMTFLGDYLRAEIGKAKVVAKTIATEVDRLVQRVRTSLRIVDESEHVRAQTLDYSAKEMVNVRGKTALVTAEELVKLDGGQVHIG